MRPDQFRAALARGLPAVTLIHGDEPFQMGECLDMLRSAARAGGIAERLVFDATTGFDWLELGNSADSLSLFAERRLFEVRLTGRPSADGAQAAERIAAAGGDDLLVMTCPKLDRKATATAWFKRLDAVASVVAVSTVAIPEMPAWVKQRFAGANIEATEDACQLLAERTEGNLLACAQEVDKLSLLLSPGEPVDARAIERSSSDSARFDSFDLVDAAVDGDAARAVRVLTGLRAEGMELPPLLGSLAWMVRMLANVAERESRGESMQQVLRNGQFMALRRRERSVRRVVSTLGASGLADCLRLAEGIDRSVKGRSDEDPWCRIERLCLLLAGAAVLDAA